MATSNPLMEHRNTTFRLWPQAASCLGEYGLSADNPGMDFRANLRRLRLAAGLTQAQLAERCGWGQSRLSNYEIPLEREGARTPDVDDAVVLATALNVPIQELYGLPSQPVKLDPAIMASALKITEALEHGRPKGDFMEWAASLIFVYSRVAAGGQLEIVDRILDTATEGREGEKKNSERGGPGSTRKR